MDSQNLIAFLAVAETGSFSLAGDKLHLTQPAVSKRIAQLEGQLDVRLFDRIGRSVTLTEAGQVLMERARLILQDIDDTRQALSNLSGEISGRLRMATSHHIGLHRLPEVLKAFSLNYPGVSLDIQFVDSEWAYSAVQRGDIELGIVTLAPQRNDERVISEPVWDDPLIFMVARDHPLARIRQPSLTDISAYPGVFPGENTFTKKIVTGYFQQLGLSLDVLMESNYLETLKMMVSIGLAWSVLPATMLSDDVQDITPKQIRINRQLGYIHHRDRTLSNAGQALINLLTEPPKP
ncbi:LysR family transcriptional regulator [Parendozoicomonas haliclonae]|uniref:HTH-type transcriptional activator CmpR n=1 Tax=Parendozoicomonas haliclonae TaxID=1960125 RepID=A0A1X7AK08_9GAMM|nr:LysR family transcriptional regulator [Parendozoicomonas haliclonae]SMA47447.1 HTH-type transcriptional activator CmpR [Parendozoicomonas haliclonae]